MSKVYRRKQGMWLMVKAFVLGSCLTTTSAMSSLIKGKSLSFRLLSNAGFNCV